MRYAVSCGRRKLVLNVPARRVVSVLRPRRVRGIEDVERAVARAIDRPTAAPPLASLLRGRRTALIVTVDHTRPSPRRLIHPLLDACAAAGVRPTVMITPGRHRAMTEAEIRAHLGPRITSVCRVLQHDAFDARRIARRGRTRRGTPVAVNRAIFEHDLVIGCGFIEPSYLCGWTGGRKILCPGLAWHKSIDHNHYFLTQPGARIGRLRGNPVSDDAADFVRGLPLHFIVYAVAGPHDEVAQVVAGDPVKAHERGCLLSGRIYRVRKKEADIVIASPGGWPYDLDLVQGKKAIIPATEAVRRNGVVILVSECPDGIGAERTFIEWLRTKTPVEVRRDVLDRRGFTLGAHGAAILARPIVEKNATVILVTRPAVARELRGTFLRVATSLNDAWDTARRLVGKDADVLFIENGRRLIVE